MLGRKKYFLCARQVNLTAHKTKFWRRERKVRFEVMPLVTNNGKTTARMRIVLHHNNKYYTIYRVERRKKGYVFCWIWGDSEERHFTFPITGKYHITIEYMNKNGLMVSENYYRDEVKIKVDKKLVEVKALREPPLFIPEENLTRPWADSNFVFSFPSISINLIPDVLKRFDNPTKQHATDLVISTEEYLNYHVGVSGFIENGENLNLSFGDKIVTDKKSKPYIFLIANLKKIEVII